MPQKKLRTKPGTSWFDKKLQTTICKLDFYPIVYVVQAVDVALYWKIETAVDPRNQIGTLARSEKKGKLIKKM